MSAIDNICQLNTDLNGNEDHIHTVTGGHRLGHTRDQLTPSVLRMTSTSDCAISVTTVKKAKYGTTCLSTTQTITANQYNNSANNSLLVNLKHSSEAIQQWTQTEDMDSSFVDMDVTNNNSIKCNNNNINCKDNGLDKWLKTFYNWSHNERIQALDSLVSTGICEVQQIRHLLTLIEPQLQRDFISLLPKELSLLILGYLDPKDLLRASQTCRNWRILCEDNVLWREKCREEGLLDDNESITDFFKRRLESSRCSLMCSTPTSPPPSNSSSPKLCPLSPDSPMQSFARSENKIRFLRQKNIEYNWRYGVLSTEKESTTPTGRGRLLKEILYLKGHDDHVITCLQFNPISNLIVSGSDDNTLKVWCSETGRCKRTLTGHTGGVWSSQLSSDNIIISGSTDRTLKVWNAMSGECLHTLYGHTSTVRCMALHENQVVSGSRDATLRVWDIKTGCCNHVLTGHVAAVRCVQFNGKLCVSGAYDYLVKVWDVSTETCLHTLEGHTNRVYSLQFDGLHIVSGSLDTSIKVWSAAEGTLKHTLVGHQSLTSGMQLRGNTLVSGNADSTVKVWDITTGQCLQTLSGPNRHQSAVTCLQFNSRFVITSSDDGTVKLWDLKTGEFIKNLVSLSSGGSGGVVWRIRASNTKLVCAVGSRNGTEETKLLVLDFDDYQDIRQTRFEEMDTTFEMDNDFDKDNNNLILL
ncbi:F-box/WD repeat-containing protein 7-like [Oppia nitens]|uniref:F-box/WD repeat-containing protein 7-like n=1 Tax=Oppia nitens TaxID=1686743 RepID=UPI0023D9F19F|nr:F-box/WD repeat-containing protein 7-like [Oppia nitens]